MKRSLLIAGLLLAGCVGEIKDPGTAPPSYVPPMEMDPVCEPYKFTPNDFFPTAFPVNVVLDAKISDHNVDLMLQAIEAWNTRMKMEVVYATITSNLNMHAGCNYALVTDSQDLIPDYIGLTNAGKCASDLVYVETMETKMADRPADYYTDDLVRNITIHEIGHVLGLDHEADPKSIMFFSMGPGDIKYISTQSYCLVQLAVINSQKPH